MYRSLIQIQLQNTNRHFVYVFICLCLPLPMSNTTVDVKHDMGKKAQTNKMNNYIKKYNYLF